MNSNFFTAHVVNLDTLHPALGQIKSEVLKTLRKLLIRRKSNDNVRFYLNNVNDEFLFYDSAGNRHLASEAFRLVYRAGYHRALFDVCQDISAELDARESCKQQLAECFLRRL